MPSFRRFEGRSFLVTGGTSGIGLATAKQLAEEGARVCILGRSEEKLAVALAQLPGEGHQTKVCDFASEESVEAAVKQFREKESGGFSGAVFCAGAHMMRPYSVTKTQHLREMFAANVETAWMGVKPLIKNLSSDESDPSIVFLSSVAAIRGGAGTAAYSAAKGALLGAARCLALELAPKKIRVNTILPGVVETPMSEKFFSVLPAAQAEAIRGAHPLGLGKPEDIAGAVTFLLSKDARWITGSELVVDGGLSCKS